jgi:hypothetical protein
MLPSSGSIRVFAQLSLIGAEGDWPAQRVLETFSPDNPKRISQPNNAVHGPKHIIATRHPSEGMRQGGLKGELDAR